MRYFARAQNDKRVLSNDKPTLSTAVTLCPTLAGLLNEYVGVNARLTHISIYSQPKLQQAW
jgi:hypothetical protein